MKKLLYCFIGLSFQVLASAQLQNLDFELCDTTAETPPGGFNCRYFEGWNRTNGDYLSETLGLPFTIGGVSETQNGDMALRLSVFYHFDKDMAIQRAPFTLLPEKLSGYYTYTDNVVNTQNSDRPEEDFATVSVLLSKWNSLLSQRDTIGFGKIHLGAAANYTSFSFPIDYVSTSAPDSIMVLLDPSRVRTEIGVIGGMGPAIPESSFFTVDNLSLEDGTVSVGEEIRAPKRKVFPNPGKGLIHIPDFAGEVGLFDLDGKMIDHQTYPDDQIDTYLLSPGIYFLRLTEKSGRVDLLKYFIH